MKVIILSVSILLSAATAVAQFMVPQTTVIRTPYGNVNHTTYTYQRMPYYGSTSPISHKYNFTVVLKDSTTLQTRARIEYKDSTNVITIKNEKEKRLIRPYETIELFRILPDGRKYAGVATDSCWLFKCSSGKINGYSTLSEQNDDYIVAIQAGDGSIVALNQDNLKDLVGDHKRALELIERKKLIKALQAYNK